MTLAADLATAAARTGWFPTGYVGHFLLPAAPTGWVETGTTIGNASSGATRANIDTYDLFVALWALNATDFPILTSAGGASTRGANADGACEQWHREPAAQRRAPGVRQALTLDAVLSFV